MNALNRSLKALSLAAGVAACFSAYATSAITFDPTGTPGPAGNLTITTLDQAPGNAIAVGVNQNSPANSAFTLYYQANLGIAYNGSVSNTVYTAGQGGNFFTFTAGFGEKIAANNGTSLTFAFDAGNPTNFYRMYATSAAGNDLAGTGFVGSSAPILTGHFVPAGYASVFVFSGGGAGTALDNFGNNDYSKTSTITGIGGTALTLVIDSFNVNYFPSLVKGATSSLINTSQALAFSQVNPSAAFTNAAGDSVAGVSSVGAVNGQSTNNTIFQADANQGFTVPEPMPTALIGVGLVGIALARRKSKAAKA